MHSCVQPHNNSSFNNSRSSPTAAVTVESGHGAGGDGGDGSGGEAEGNNKHHKKNTHVFILLPIRICMFPTRKSSRLKNSKYSKVQVRAEVQNIQYNTYQYYTSISVVQIETEHALLLIFIFIFFVLFLACYQEINPNHSIL